MIEKSGPRKVSAELKPLDVEDIQQVADLVRDFRIAISNILLYPPESDLVVESIGAVHAVLTRVLEKYKTLLLSETEGQLLVNSKPIDIKGEKEILGIFTESLKACNIKSITFKQGLTVKELRLFLGSLAHKHKLKGEGETITAKFEKERVVHIGLNEKVYTAISDSDLVIERGAELLQKSGGTIDSIMKVLEEVTEIVSSVDDAPTRDKLKLEIAKKMVATDPNMLVELVKGKPEAGSTMGVMSGLPRRVKAGRMNATPTKQVEGEVIFLPEELKTIVSNITRGYQELQKGETNGFTSLKKALDRIITLTKDKVSSLELYKELVKETDVLERTSEWTAPAQGETLSDQIQGLIAKDTLSLLNEETIDKTRVMLENISSDEELKLGKELIKRLLENLEVPVADVRLKAAFALKKLYPTVEALQDKELMKYLDNRLAKKEKQESHGDVYSEIAAILQHAAIRCLKEGNYKKTFEIIKLFRDHGHSKLEGFLRRQKRAEEIMNKLAGSEITRLLLDDIYSKDTTRHSRAVPLLIELGDSVVSQLIRRIKETEDIETRKLIASLIEKIGETGITRLIEELGIDKKPLSSLRILELLDKVGHDELVVEQLRETLSNPDFRVRREALNQLYRIGTERAKEIILGTVDDPSPMIQQKVVEIIGELKYAPAVDTLTALVTSRRMPLARSEETLQREACVALGKIGESRVIPALEEAATLPRSFRPVKPERVRLAAVQALQVLGYKHMDKFSRDRNPFIRKLVEE